MLNMTAEWLYRHGHSSNLSKLRISMLTADQEAYTGPVEMIDWVWLPGPQLEPDPVRRAKALQFYNGPASTSDAVYLGHQFGGGQYGHVRRQTAIAARAVRDKLPWRGRKSLTVHPQFPCSSIHVTARDHPRG